MNHAYTTTAFDLPGHRTVSTLGVVRGITVRSRSIVGSFIGGLQTIVGGNITIYTELCERARQDAFELMVQHAQALGANAIIGVDLDYETIGNGGSMLMVSASGTAVVIE